MMTWFQSRQRKERGSGLLMNIDLKTLANSFFFFFCSELFKALDKSKSATLTSNDGSPSKVMGGKVVVSGLESGSFSASTPQVLRF